MQRSSTTECCGIECMFQCNTCQNKTTSWTKVDAIPMDAQSWIRLARLLTKKRISKQPTTKSNTRSSNHKMMKSVIVVSLFFVQPVFATTLVRRGSLVQVSSDSSDLTFGGALSSNDAGNGCSSNTYYDDCPGVQGTRVYTKSSSSSFSKGPLYVLNGDLVTYCGRWRRLSNCVIGGGTTGTTNTATTEDRPRHGALLALTLALWP